MTLNLIDDPWIPMQNPSGDITLLAPWKISNDVSQVSSTRADFNANLSLFLIGLVQTSAPPSDEDDWDELYHEPPSEKELHQKMQAVAPYFSLHDDQFPFLQDPKAATGKEIGILELLLESPTGQTLRHNKDLFIKRQSEGGLCACCAAAALYTLQMNAPEGGRGHNVSMRGGGPLTTIIQGTTLWKTVWSNVLDDGQAKLLKGDMNKSGPHDRFPWAGEIRPGGKGGRPTIPSDGHPLMMFWGMPRRILLDPAEEQGICSICGAEAKVIRSCRTSPSGFQYQGWEHPLSPHRSDSDARRALRTSPRGMSYRDWLGWVVEDQDSGTTPSIVVREFMRNRAKALEGDSLRIWGFGYETRQNAVLSWQESMMPLLHVPPESLEDFEERTRELVQGAEKMRYPLEKAIKQAMFRRPGDVNGDISYVTAAFWSRTQSEFRRHHADVLEYVKKGEAHTPVFESWHQSLSSEAKALFTEYAMGGSFAPVDPQRVAVAWTWLVRTIHSKKMRGAFGLPPKKGRTSPANEAIEIPLHSSRS